MKFKIYILLLFLNFNCMVMSQSQWTWSYRKKFNTSELDEISSRDSVVFSKADVPKFNQLIFSFNSLRPKHGYFTFYVKPRFSSSKQWGKWYKMLEWGKGVQRSFAKINRGDVSYDYVRLEMPTSDLADGFKVKVVADKRTSLSYLRMLSASVSNLSMFEIEKVKDLVSLPSVEIKQIPLISQMALDHAHFKRMCSPVATSMLISYLNKSKQDPVEFANKAYDNGLDAYGSWPFNTAAAFEVCPNRYFRVARLSSFKDLHEHILHGTPVVVSVRGRINGAPQDYPKGHLILVVGWDKSSKEVIVHDPAFSNHSQVKIRYELSTFMRAWERSHRLAYLADKI